MRIRVPNGRRTPSGPVPRGAARGPTAWRYCYFFGVTEFDRAEAAPVPAAVTAATVKV